TLRIGSSRFTSTRSGGYDESEVDDFLDGLVAALSMEEPDEDITAQIDAVTFTPTHLRSGYAPADVDALLDEVSTALGATPSRAAAAGAIAAPSTQSAPSALIPPRKGPLARLFGR
ncbi:MAG: hypothetical protein JWP82_381, partial [Humibacillus sp.]|nr:hypothetical protein [Humibacillus sp.]